MALKNEDIAPAARVPKSVTHLKVDAEILDVHLGKTLPLGTRMAGEPRSIDCFGKRHIPAPPWCSMTRR
jgi:hypothetical protein